MNTLIKSGDRVSIFANWTSSGYAFPTVATITETGIFTTEGAFIKFADILDTF